MFFYVLLWAWRHFQLCRVWACWTEHIDVIWGRFTVKPNETVTINHSTDNTIIKVLIRLRIVHQLSCWKQTTACELAARGQSVVVRCAHAIFTSYIGRIALAVSNVLVSRFSKVSVSALSVSISSRSRDVSRFGEVSSRSRFEKRCQTSLLIM